jgi:hypothetical protein
LALVLGAAERQALLEAGALFKSYVDRWVGSLRKSVPDMRVADLPGAGHFVSSVAKKEVLAEIHRFMADIN